MSKQKLHEKCFQCGGTIDHNEARNPQSKRIFCKKCSHRANAAFGNCINNLRNRAMNPRAWL